MESEPAKSQPKFKFSSKPKPVKEQSTELKEKENFNIEELKKYYADFILKFNKIEENLKNFDSILSNEQLAKEHKKNMLEEIAAEIKELKEDYKNNATFLVGYDKQNYMNMIDNLTESYEEKKEKLNPKKKFAFSSKGGNKSSNVKLHSSGINTNAHTSININKTVLSSNQIDEKAEFILKDKSDLNNFVITKEEVTDKNNLILENISNSEIYILHNLKACYIKNIKDCKIFIGSVSGGTHITNCVNSSIYLATHQLRIHQTAKTAFYIIATSNPIIEDCASLTFSPLNISYSTFSENLAQAKIDVSKNKWNGVLDFKWHKKEKSPNFDLVDESTLTNLNL